MLILGLNMFHAGASAAIIQDGEAIIAVAEVRLNRIKH
jgi:predicted NodU family carbamoyl transferase